ncbi:MAG: lysine--tRNA ligase, partial [Gemmatimonadaceae bacterium]
MSDELNFVLKARREKLDALVARGEQVFGYSFDRTHSAAGAAPLLAADAEEGPVVSVAGRIVAWRAHGKTAFEHVADESGKSQPYFRKNELGED